MEEELDFLSENATVVIPWGTGEFLMVHDLLMPTFCVVGILGEIAIIFLITRWHHLRSVTNLVLAHWASIDLLYTFLSCILFNTTLYSIELKKGNFTVIHILEKLILTTLDFGQITCIYLLLTNSLLNSSKVTIKILVASLYTLITIFFFTALIFYVQNIPMIIMIRINKGIYILVLITVIIKLIANQIKRNAPTNKNNEIRFRIVAIYISLWLVSLTSYILALDVNYFSFLFVFGRINYLTPLFIILYLRTVDPNFKLCLMKMLKNNSGQNERFTFQVNQSIEEQV